MFLHQSLRRLADITHEKALYESQKLEILPFFSLHSRATINFHS